MHGTKSGKGSKEIGKDMREKVCLLWFIILAVNM